MRYNKYSVDDVRIASSQKKFNVISTFAGGGGSSLGYRLAGGNVVLINEFVEAAVETYTANFPDTKVLTDDIKQLTGEDFLKATGLNAGDLDILDGSPPCSAFSVAGRREKGWGQEKKYSDGKKQVAIEDLFYEFIRIAKDIQPKIIVAENVRGITFGEARPKLNAFINAFEDIGYSTTYKVLNAADYGVPQARERTIFICIRDDVLDKVGLSFLNIHGIFPDRTIDKHISLGEALVDIENDEEEVKMLEEFVQGSYQKKFIEPLPFYPTKHTKPSMPEFAEWNPKGSCFNMIRPCADLPCPTLTQQGQKRGMSGVFHPGANRKLTIKECKRLMGFPEDFILTGDFDTQVERLGRAVAPLMYKAVADSLYDTVIKEFNNG